MRLDSHLLKQGMFTSRTKAKEAIVSRLVEVDAKTITKPSFELTEGMSVVVKSHKSYVARSAWKLAGFLEEVSLNVEGKTTLDIGSSTGGFTQVLLENGATSVTCVDVGTNQLHESLRNNSKVVLYEQTDIRDFNHEPFELVVSDISFISLRKILDKIDLLAKKEIVLLFKPQFEVGLVAKRDKKGVVRDKKAIALAQSRFEDAAKLLGWSLEAVAPAVITGKEGNLEYCYYFKK